MCSSILTAGVAPGADTRDAVSEALPDEITVSGLRFPAVWKEEKSAKGAEV